MTQPYLSIVIPAYNESATIQQVVMDHVKILHTLQTQLAGAEIICLDDASTDNTYDILRQLSQQIKELKVLRHEVNEGIFSSFMDAFQAARGTHIFQTAADNQWPAKNLSKLFHRIMNDHLDLVIGVRENRKEIYTPWRQFLSYGFNLIPKWLFDIETKDANGIKLGRREIFIQTLISKSFFGEIERIVEAKKKGFKIDYEPIEFLPRHQGKASGAKWRNIFSTGRDLIKYLVLHLKSR